MVVATAVAVATAPGAHAIVGGTPASRADFPFFAVVGRGACGGALIAPDRVLTAAHCRAELDSGRRFVLIGPRNERRRVARMAVHPVYRRYERRVDSDEGTLPADLMVLELSRPVTGIAPLELARAGDGLTTPGTSAVVIGRGATDPRQEKPDGRFRRGNVAILADSQCKRELVNRDFRRWSLCTRDPRSFDRTAKRPFVSPCFGDSGGPLLVERDGRPVGVGVVSFGLACGTKRDPEVYADVAQGRAFALDPSPDWMPSALGRPVITGKPKVGRVLTCAVRWADPPRKVTYDFLVGDSGPRVSRSPRYRVRSRDRGKRVRCQALAESRGGIAASPLSAAVRIAG